MLVVYRHPTLRLCPGFCQRWESIGIEDFDTIGSVEALDVGVLRRTTWLDEIPDNVVGFGPCLYGMAPEFRTVVAANG